MKMKKIQLKNNNFVDYLKDSDLYLDNILKEKENHLEYYIKHKPTFSEGPVEDYELPGLMETVKFDVDDLLESWSVDCCEACFVDTNEFAARYQKKQEKILLTHREFTQALRNMIHEYTHRVQHTLLKGIGKKYSFFKEGHARGVERIVARSFARRRDNYTGVIRGLESDILDINSVNNWLRKGSRPEDHKIGNVLMMLLEEKKGINIYRDYLRAR
jgi:hypothetical protein